MQTGLFEIKFIDGRTFKVFCENVTQIQKLSRFYHRERHRIVSIENTSSGIHTANTFLKIMEQDDK